MLPLILANALGYVCSGAMILFIVFLVSTIINTVRKLRDREISFDEIPDKLRQPIRRLVPDIDILKVVVKFKEPDVPHEYEITGLRDGKPIQIEVEPTKDQNSIHEIEIEYEPRKSHRRWPHAEPIDLSEVPVEVVRAAMDHMESIGCPMNEVRKVRSGNIQGQVAYEFKSTWKQWRVEIRLLSTREVLMLEFKAPRKTKT